MNTTQTSSKTGLVALIIDESKGGKPQLLEALSDEKEISLYVEALESSHPDPLKCVYEWRVQQEQEDEEFGNYVEELLSQPFVKPEILHHGVQWLKSKMRIEEFRKSELEATRVIATYAYDIYCRDPQKSDFVLSGPTASVRVRILPTKAEIAASNAA